MCIHCAALLERIEPLQCWWSFYICDDVMTSPLLSLCQLLTGPPASGVKLMQQTAAAVRCDSLVTEEGSGHEEVWGCISHHDIQIWLQYIRFWKNSLDQNCLCMTIEQRLLHWAETELRYLGSKYCRVMQKLV